MENDKWTMENTDERFYWLGFSAFPGIGPVRFQKLLAFFGSAKRAWKAPLTELQQSLRVEKLSEEFVAFRKQFSPLSYYKEIMQKRIDFVTLADERYPKLLAKIKQAPFVLFTTGALQLDIFEKHHAVAIVGSRKMTEYGKQVTEDFAGKLAAAGCVIVSGLALGVDAASHAATLTGGGRTIAVLGCGVDCCYPLENYNLYKRIVLHGAIISEFPPGQKPTKGSFLSRNRIIAGLSLGVIVTEGAEDSGALVTAEYAFAEGRQVFAVPGPITSAYSKGPHKLIEKGARLVTSAEEVLAALQIESTKGTKSTKSIKGDTEEEQKVIELLREQQMHVDELTRRLKIEPSKIGSILTLMEMKGLVKSLEGGFFRLA